MNKLIYLLCTICLIQVSCTAQEQKKNVLFLVVDDLNTWLLQNPDRYTGKVIAPNILKLADSGVRFDQAFCASPKCSPSRTALLSGVSPWKSGVYDNGVDVMSSQPLQAAISLPRVLQDNGYYTASFGKISHGYDTGLEYDANRNHNRDEVPPDAPFNGWAKIMKDGVMVRTTESDWGPIHIPESEMNDTKYADLAIKELKKNHDKPFFIACGLFHPHMPWYVPQKYLDMYPLDKIELPPLKEDDLDDLPEMARSIINDGVYTKVRELDQYKEAIQGYLASTTYSDHHMGRVLDALENSPYKNNTIVVLMSDHGFHLGEKRHWQKGTLWEEATNCLLMFHVPGVTQPGQVSQRTVSLQDVYPTIMELAGIETPEHVDGHSLVSLLEDSDASWNHPAITAYQSHITVRTDKYRYIRYTDGSTEFYDRGEDPNEWVNQSGNEEYAGIIRKLDRYLPAQEDMAPAIGRKQK